MGFEYFRCAGKPSCCKHSKYRLIISFHPILNRLVGAAQFCWIGAVCFGHQHSQIGFAHSSDFVNPVHPLRAPVRRIAAEDVAAEMTLLMAGQTHLFLVPS